MITTETYQTFDEAYEYLNNALFGGQLKPCIITFQRKPRAKGYYSPGRFDHRHEEDRAAAELAMNPDTFRGEEDIDIMSTIAHEMCHHWQYQYGKPGRRGYHNKEWAAKMDEIGLTPTSDGTPDGKRTGQRMSHLIEEDGKFEQVARQWLNFHSFEWQSFKNPPGSRKQTRAKFTCPGCKLNAWSKPGAYLVCGDCETEMVISG